MLEGLLVDLVPFGKQFQDQEHKWINGPTSFFTGMGDYRFRTHNQIGTMLQKRAEANEHGRSGMSFGVQAKNGKPLGYMGLNFVSYENRVANLGAHLGEQDYLGGGYGTDALTLLIDYAFDWLDLRRLWLSTMGINARVMRQMEKVGFTLEARQRAATLADSVWIDVLQYGILREEWPGRAATIEKLGLRPKP
jgi:RimJ/RimL family protein N-acetyltransferase